MKKKFILSLAYWLLAAGTSFLFAGYMGDLGEVVVTPSRSRVEAYRWPGWVSVITSRQIAQSGAETVDEVLGGQTGLNRTNLTGVRGQARVDLRGMGENSHLGTLVMVDGVRINRPDMGGINWLEIPVGSIERIEVVRGPGSVLYGNNAAGGVINIITRDAREGESSLALTTGAESYGLFSQSVNFNRSAGNWAFFLSGERFRETGYRSRSGNLSEGVTFKASGNSLPLGIKVSLRGSLYESFYEMPGSLTRAELKEDRTQARYTDWSGWPNATRADNREDESREKRREISGSFKLPLSGSILLRTEGGWSGRSEEVDFPSSGSFADREMNYLYISPFIEMENEVLMPLRLSAGGDIGKHTLDLNRFSSEERDIELSEVDIKMPSYGAYVYGETEPAENLILSAGLRREEAEVKVAHSLKTADGSRTHRGNAFTWGLVYMPYPGLRGYFSAGTHYRYPAADEQAAFQGIFEGFFKDLDAETGETYEAGVALGIPWGEVKVSAYRKLINDMIKWDDNLERNINADRTRRDGLEASADLALFRNLSLSLGASAGETLFRKGDYRGNEMPLVPGYEFSAAVSLRPYPGFKVSADSHYTGERYRGGDYGNNLSKLSSYTLVNLNCLISIVRGAEIKLGVRNLFNQLYSQAWWDEFTGTGWYPAPERSYRAALRAVF